MVQAKSFLWCVFFLPATSTSLDRPTHLVFIDILPLTIPPS